MTVAAVVLAGGRSSRFGRDKLAEPIDGRPMLWRSIDAVRPVVDEILVVIAPGADPSLPPLARSIRDPEAFEGPLAGAAAGLAASDADIVLIVGADMPWMLPAVLRRLVLALDDGAEAAVLESDGAARPLPIAVRRQPGLDRAVTLLASGERRLRALEAGLATTVILEAVWRLDDAAGLTLRDIDTHADLDRP
jgi:molybdopterin-guanine dinucleotide biosynthesis protein A